MHPHRAPNYNSASLLFILGEVTLQECSEGFVSYLRTVLSLSLSNSRISSISEHSILQIARIEWFEKLSAQELTRTGLWLSTDSRFAIKHAEWIDLDLEMTLDTLVAI